MNRRGFLKSAGAVIAGAIIGRNAPENPLHAKVFVAEHRHTGGHMNVMDEIKIDADYLYVHTGDGWRRIRTGSF